MNKTPSKSKAYSLTLRVRSESGLCEISMGIDAMQPEERKFLFDTLRKTKQGGTIGFDMNQTKEGEQRLTLLLKQPSVNAAVREQIAAH